MLDYKPPPSNKDSEAVKSEFAEVGRKDVHLTNADSSNAHPTTVQRTTVQRMTIRFEWRDWLPYIEDMEGTEAEKRAVIEALWAIVIGFMDLGCEVSDTVDKSRESLDLSAALRAAVVQTDYKQELEEV